MKKYTFADNHGELGNEESLHDSVESLQNALLELIHSGDLEDQEIRVYTVEEIGIACLYQTITFTSKDR